MKHPSTPNANKHTWKRMETRFALVCEDCGFVWSPELFDNELPKKCTPENHHG